MLKISGLSDLDCWFPWQVCFERRGRLAPPLSEPLTPKWRKYKYSRTINRWTEGCDATFFLASLELHFQDYGWVNFPSSYECFLIIIHN